MSTNSTPCIALKPATQAAAFGMRAVIFAGEQRRKTDNRFPATGSDMKEASDL